ncbi:MAG: cbb3-type cytochrome c oxidase subunit II [Geminicoccaceae bacterium]
MSLLSKHDKVETRGFLLLILILIAVSIGGLSEIAPLFKIETTIENVKVSGPTPRWADGPQHLHPRGLRNCHSQMIGLPRRVERYGHYSLAAEHVRPSVQWGSKRTGPDLARVGGKYSNQWQAAHLVSRATWCPRASCRPMPSSWNATCTPATSPTT